MIAPEFLPAVVAFRGLSQVYGDGDALVEKPGKLAPLFLRMDIPRIKSGVNMGSYDVDSVGGFGRYLPEKAEYPLPSPPS